MATLFGVSPGEWIVVATFLVSLIGQWYLLGYRTRIIEKWIEKHEVQTSERERNTHNIELIAKGQDERLKIVENLLQMFVGTIVVPKR